MSNFISKANEASLYGPFNFKRASDKAAKWSENVGYELHKCGAEFAGFLRIDDMEALAKAILECCNASGDSIDIVFDDLDLQDCVVLESFLDGYKVVRSIEFHKVSVTKI